jgi:hypothetical protein
MKVVIKHDQRLLAHHSDLCTDDVLELIMKAAGTRAAADVLKVLEHGPLTIDRPKRQEQLCWKPEDQITVMSPRGDTRGTEITIDFSGKW